MRAPAALGFALLAASVLLAHAAQDTAAIGGRVVDAVTGEPVPHARIRASPQVPPAASRQPAPAPATASADTNGRFAIGGLRGGEYEIVVSAAGYLDGGFGANVARAALATLTLAEGQRHDAVIVRLWREAVIEGIVGDARGRPMIGAQVEVVSDETEWSTVGYADDRGAYRIGRIAPGRYRVFVPAGADSRALDRTAVAHPRNARFHPFLVDRTGQFVLLLSNVMPPPPDAAGAPRLFVTSHYRGDTPRTASVLTLTSGETRSNVDITMEERRAVRVAGTVVGPNGPVPGALVTLYPKEDAERTHRGWTIATSSASGEFVFVLAPTGEYTLRARRHGLSRIKLSRDGLPEVPSDDVIITDPEDYAAAMPLTVGRSEISGLTVRMAAGTTVSGTVVIDRGTLVPYTTGKNAVVFGRIGGEPGVDERWGNIAKDGHFSAKMQPGDYVIVAGSDSAGLWLERATRAGRDLGTRALKVGTEPIRDLQIVLTDRATELSGAVLGQRGDDIPVPKVVVFTADRVLWGHRVDGSVRGRFLRARGGRYSVRGLVHGEYYATAVREIRDEDWWSPARLSRLARRARRVRLESGRPVTLDLQVHE